MSAQSFCLPLVSLGSRWMAVVALIVIASVAGSAFAQDESAQNETVQDEIVQSDQPTTNSAKITQDDDTPTVAAATEEDVLAALPPEVVEAGKKAKDEFLKIKEELSKSLVTQRATHIRYQNDEDRNLPALERYREERNRSRQLMNDLFDAGLEVIRFVPDQEVLTYAITIIEHRMENDFYDETSMEVGARLIDGGFRHGYLFPATMRAGIVNGDFKLARKLLEVLDVEKLSEVDRKFAYMMDELEKEYEKDQILQKQDDEKNNNPRVKMVTSRGDVTIELFINQAPSTVANFIQLIESGYYDGLDFHQVIDHLLALTGDESGTGEGDTGKFLMDENERPDARYGLTGSLIMAKRPIGEGKFVPNSSSAQWAILIMPLVSVPSNQTVFGRVIEGMDVISELRRVDPSKKKKKNAIVLPPDRILSMEMIRRPETLPEIQYADPQKDNNMMRGGVPNTMRPTTGN